MKDHTYWTFDERHPRPRGRCTLYERAARLFDRLDDTLTAWAAYLAYRRIKRLS